MDLFVNLGGVTTTSGSGLRKLPILKRVMMMINITRADGRHGVITGPGREEVGSSKVWPGADVFFLWDIVVRARLSFHRAVESLFHNSTLLL